MGCRLAKPKLTTKFGSTVARKLKAGETSLIAQLAALFSADGGGASLAMTPDGKIIATWHTDGSSRPWDLESWSIVSELRGHGTPVTALSFSADARFFLSESLDNTSLI